MHKNLHTLHLVDELKQICKKIPVPRIPQISFLEYISLSETRLDLEKLQK